MNRYDLTETQWEQLQVLLPLQKPPGGGRPGNDLRTTINGILWILRTGAPWRGLPERYGVWSSVKPRFYRWRQAGLWDTLLPAVQQNGDVQGQLDWQLHYLDGSVIRAHQHAAGAKKRPGERGVRLQPGWV